MQIWKDDVGDYKFFVRNLKSKTYMWDYTQTDIMTERNGNIV